MKPKYFLTVLGVSSALCLSSSATFAADTAMKSTAKEKMFIKKAAMGGMAEVAMGKTASEKGGSKEVKDFGSQMVSNHTKINDNLKGVADKLGVTLPTELDSMHQAKDNKMGKMSGAEFDQAYVKEMVADHEKDISEFEKAQTMVKNDDLKKFIADSLPIMKDHLEKIKKFDQAKGSH